MPRGKENGQNPEKGPGGFKFLVSKADWAYSPFEVKEIADQKAEEILSRWLRWG